MKKYLSIDEVIVLHKYLINEFGGSQGLRSRDSLESAYKFFMKLFKSNSFKFDNLLPWFIEHIKKF